MNFIRSSAISSSRRDPAAGVPGTSMNASPVPEISGTSSSSSKCIRRIDDSKGIMNSAAMCSWERGGRLGEAAPRRRRLNEEQQLFVDPRVTKEALSKVRSQHFGLIYNSVH